MKLIITVIICSLFFITPLLQSADLLDSALATVGKTKADLGYHPKGYWNRYPYVIPYKLPAFDDLFAEPLRIYDYSYSMKSAVEHYMADSNIVNPEISSLYQLSYHLGWERKVGGFRNYSANLIDTVASPTPLFSIIEDIYLFGGEFMEARAFGSGDGMRDSLRQLTSSIDQDVQQIVAVLLANLLDAARYHQLAFRNVDPEIIKAIYDVNDLDATQGDGQVYYPQFDDCARTIDWQSLVYASYKTAAAVDLAAKNMIPLRDKGSKLAFEFETPLGKILLNGYGRHTVEEDDYLLICDFGGGDIYHAGAGANPDLPISVIIDLDGKDQYGSEKTTKQFGSGICGIGILVDLGGDDKYLADRLSFGLGIFGTGLLYDLKGKDNYKMWVSGQGCGYFGIGMLIDRLGDDNYYLAGDGQGAGGVGGGIGILADYKGNDHYTAEPYAEIFNRGDYHSKMKINANNAQGWGGGRRGDGSDGHSWAGGMGVLIDSYGDDEYYAGNFSIGVGYWFGIGILYDSRGDDLYKSCYFSQASGAHFCIGAIFDEEGDDRHELYETAGAGLAFGWDFTIAMLIDWQGNDFYYGKIISTALSQIRSNAFLFDFGGGDDIYQLNQNTAGMGESSFREAFRTMRPMTPFPTYAQSYGILIDVGGNDQYLDYVDSLKATVVRDDCRNDTIWYRPKMGSDMFGFDNYGIGLDTDSGSVEHFFIYQKKEK